VPSERLVAAPRPQRRSCAHAQKSHSDLDSKIYPGVQRCRATPPATIVASESDFDFGGGLEKQLVETRGPSRDQARWERRKDRLVTSHKNI